ncbi:hypothetical protein ABC383_07215 [Noviherbaspirillum sp. 1P10PC]|uniref:hypothetical protein n=1 Tax=Noviherbaspirillum sp. 1P10PC TaxID=3132292 RepID=UPI0039A20470
MQNLMKTIETAIADSDNASLAARFAHLKSIGECDARTLVETAIDTPLFLFRKEQFKAAVAYLDKQEADGSQAICSDTPFTNFLQQLVYNHGFDGVLERLHATLEKDPQKLE